MPTGESHNHARSSGAQPASKGARPTGLAGASVGVLMSVATPSNEGVHILAAVSTRGLEVSGHVRSARFHTEGLLRARDKSHGGVD